MNGGMTGPGKWVGQLILGAVLAVASLVVLSLNLKWITSVFEGPVEVRLADLRNLESPRDLPNPWVSFTFDKALDTGVELVSSRSNAPKARYLLVQVRDRWLIAEVPPDHAGNRVTGYVEAWSAPLNRQVIADIAGKFPQHPLLPVQVDAVYNQRAQCYSLLGVMVFFLICGLALVVMGLATRRRQLLEGS
jgi:hypothetical protein